MYIVIQIVLYLGFLQRTSLLTAQPFTRPQELHPSNVIVTKLTRIQDYLLKRFDPELHEYLQSMDIVPQIYGMLVTFIMLLNLQFTCFHGIFINVLK